VARREIGDSAALLIATGMDKPPKILLDALGFGLRKNQNNRSTAAR
jgi:hypothetical protein